MRSIALAVALVASLATAARAEVKNLNGQVPPELGPVEQVNGSEQAAALGALKGKVVMLEFFATW